MPLGGLLFLLLLAFMAAAAVGGALVLAWRDGYGTRAKEPRIRAPTDR